MKPKAKTPGEIVLSLSGRLSKPELSRAKKAMLDHDTALKILAIGYGASDKHREMLFYTIDLVYEETVNRLAKKGRAA
jgi:hypothetical protein